MKETRILFVYKYIIQNICCTVIFPFFVAVVGLEHCFFDFNKMANHSQKERNNMNLKKNTGYQPANKYFDTEQRFTAVTTKRVKRKWDSTVKAYTDEIESYVYSFAYDGCEEVLEVKFSTPQEIVQFNHYQFVDLEVFEDWSSRKAYFKAESVMSC